MAFNPFFTITPKINKALVEIEAEKIRDIKGHGWRTKYCDIL
jgi:hypothetical protein